MCVASNDAQRLVQAHPDADGDEQPAAGRGDPALSGLQTLEGASGGLAGDGEGERKDEHRGGGDLVDDAGRWFVPG